MRHARERAYLMSDRRSPHTDMAKRGSGGAADFAAFNREVERAAALERAKRQRVNKASPARAPAPVVHAPAAATPPITVLYPRSRSSQGAVSPVTRSSSVLLASENSRSRPPVQLSHVSPALDTPSPHMSPDTPPRPFASPVPLPEAPLARRALSAPSPLPSAPLLRTSAAPPLPRPVASRPLAQLPPYTFHALLSEPYPGGEITIEHGQTACACIATLVASTFKPIGDVVEADGSRPTLHALAKRYLSMDQLLRRLPPQAELARLSPCFEEWSSLPFHEARLSFWLFVAGAASLEAPFDVLCKHVERIASLLYLLLLQKHLGIDAFAHSGVLGCLLPQSAFVSLDSMQTVLDGETWINLVTFSENDAACKQGEDTMFLRQPFDSPHVLRYIAKRKAFLHAGHAYILAQDAWQMGWSTCMQTLRTRVAELRRWMRPWGRASMLDGNPQLRHITLPARQVARRLPGMKATGPASLGFQDAVSTEQVLQNLPRCGRGLYEVLLNNGTLPDPLRYLFIQMFKQSGGDLDELEALWVASAKAHGRPKDKIQQDVQSIKTGRGRTWVVSCHKLRAEGPAKGIRGLCYHPASHWTVAEAECMGQCGATAKPGGEWSPVVATRAQRSKRGHVMIQSSFETMKK